jgi:hypothetical protein
MDKRIEPVADKAQKVDLESAGAVTRSASGKLSVSIGEVMKTETFRRDLKVLGRIRELSAKLATSR